MLQINSRSAFGLAAMLGIASAVLAPSAQAAPARGTLLTSNFLTSHTRDAIGAMLASEPQAGQPKCNVRVAEFTYATVGVEGEPATASGVLLIPDGKRCAGPYPLLGWGRPTGTVRAEEQAKDIRDAKGNDPLVTRLASQGYVVVSSDYLGLGKSNYGYHPYLHSATEASATIDAMRCDARGAQRVATLEHAAVRQGDAVGLFAGRPYGDGHPA